MLYVKEKKKPTKIPNLIQSEIEKKIHYEKKVLRLRF